MKIQTSVAIIERFLHHSSSLYCNFFPFALFKACKELNIRAVTNKKVTKLKIDNGELVLLEI